jgi:hypothetical protein
MGGFTMEQETQVDVTQETTENVEVQETETQDTETSTETKKSSAEILRELSKQFGVNLFEDSGVQALNEKLTTTTNELASEKQARLKAEEAIKAFETKEQENQLKIEALSLGFTSDNLEEALALAKVYAKDGNIADGLKKAKEKFGSVLTGNIGTQFNDMQGEKPDVPKSEIEKYMAANPHKYKNYIKN